MKGRIPLWVDLSGIPADRRDAFQAAAHAANVERIIHAGSDVQRITIRSAADQQTAMDAHGIVVIEGHDWTVIPLENLIAARRDRPGTLFAVARSAEEALRHRDTLEIGVHGIVLEPDTPDAITATDAALRARGPRPDDAPVQIQAASNGLVAATITAIEDVGPGERVCIDCTERFHDGEGVLVGSTARSFILVHAETIASEYVNPRPFRVNAGAIHSYLLGPDGRTQYLSELGAGSQVAATTADGATRPLTVGRAKIEHRPHTLVRWTTPDGGIGSAVLQTAETVRLVLPDGTTRSITALRPGDQVMVRNESAARHFGMPVEERLVER